MRRWAATDWLRTTAPSGTPSLPLTRIAWLAGCSPPPCLAAGCVGRRPLLAFFERFSCIHVQTYRGHSTLIRLMTMDTAEPCWSYEYMACLQKGGRGELLPRAHFVKTIVILLREVREALPELLPKGRLPYALHTTAPDTHQARYARLGREMSRRMCDPAKLHMARCVPLWTLARSFSASGRINVSGSGGKHAARLT